jgi:hypothetical protein
MKKAKLRPAGIVALKSKAHLVRQVALEQALSYEEIPVAEEDDVIRFSFEPMDDATTRKLVFAIPREAFARRAIIGGGPPPGVDKETSGFASPLEFQAAVCELFPAFSQEFELDEAIDTYHQVVMALTPRLANYLSTETDRKTRAFCAVVNEMVEAGGNQRNAIETCLLEHASQLGCRKLLQPHLSATAKRELR